MNVCSKFKSLDQCYTNIVFCVLNYFLYTLRMWFPKVHNAKWNPISENEKQGCFSAASFKCFDNRTNNCIQLFQYFL